jgi:hypothetical protein
MSFRRLRSLAGMNGHWRPVLVLVFLAGCGGDSFERGTVRGQVTFKGKNVEQGVIQFSPLGETKGRLCGADIVAGKYEINVDGPAVGTHRVEIQEFRKTGRKVPDLMGDVSIPNRPLIDEVVPALPAKYNVESTLTAEIEPKENVIDFALGP